MVIETGCVADADEVLCAILVAQAVIPGQNYINSMTQSASQTTYDTVFGRNFCCYGNVCVDMSCGIGGCFTLNNTNYCDTYSTTGCWNAVTPTQYGPTPCYTGPTTVYSCVCTGNCWVTSADGGNICGIRTTFVFGNRLYLDCYSLTFCALSYTNNCSCNTYVAFSFGDCMIYCCTGTGVFGRNIACAKHEFRKVAGTTCYDYYKDTVCQCRIGPVTMSTKSYCICAWTVNAVCQAANVVFYDILECWSSPPKVRMCQIDFGYIPDYVIATTHKTDNDGLLRYDILCATDNTVLCSGLCVNVPYSVESEALQCYKFQFYNCCLCNNCATGLCLKGVAITGATR